MCSQLISVIIPVYNAEPYLERCIDSVINQTYTSLEIILVEDASTDLSRKICQEYANKEERIKLILHDKNQGQSAARNHGLDICTGAFIGFVDADDYVENDFYEVLLSSMIKDDLDIVECGRHIFTLDGNIMKENPRSDFITEGNRANLEAFIALGSYDVSPWDKLYRRELFSTLRFEEGKIYEDAIMLLRAFYLAAKCGSITYKGYNLVLSSGSTLRSGYSLKRLDKIYMYEDRYLFCKEHMEHLADYSLYGICFFIVANHYRLWQSQFEEKQVIMKDLAKKYKHYYKMLCQSDQIRKVSRLKRCLMKIFYFQPFLADNLLRLVAIFTRDKFRP